ncbi:MAG: NAD(P)H-dependent oxidoreductase, partial [Akkermansiaceae bacterium]|nr:NAD(P)H-dependent oxidoreductase [Akkermansiaceae bacterium]
AVPKPGALSALPDHPLHPAQQQFDLPEPAEVLDRELKPPERSLSIAGWSPTPVRDDLDAILPKLNDPQFGGLIIGSPAYFRSLSSLCKAFIERCMPLREGAKPLVDKPVGALAVARSWWASRSSPPCSATAWCPWAANRPPCSAARSGTRRTTS